MVHWASTQFDASAFKITRANIVNPRWYPIGRAFRTLADRMARASLSRPHRTLADVPMVSSDNRAIRVTLTLDREVYVESMSYQFQFRRYRVRLRPVITSPPVNHQAT